MKDNTVFVQAVRSNIIHIRDAAAIKQDGYYYHKTRCNRRLKTVFTHSEPTRTIGFRCERCGSREDYEEVNETLRERMLAKKARAKIARQRKLDRYNVEQEQRQQAVPEIAAALESLGWTVAIEHHARGAVLTCERGVLDFEARL